VTLFRKNIFSFKPITDQIGLSTEKQAFYTIIQT